MTISLFNYIRKWQLFYLLILSLGLGASSAGASSDFEEDNFPFRKNLTKKLHNQRKNNKTKIDSYNTGKNQPKLSSLYSIPRLPTHRYYHTTLTSEEIEKVIEFAKTIPSEEAKVGGNKNADNLTRKSSIKWLPKTEELKWLYQKLDTIVETCNDENYKFDIYGSEAKLQYTEYYEPDGFYNWHQDIGEISPNRKLSIVVQLSDPKEYSGGTLQIKYSKSEYDVPKQKGAAVIFPSYMLHRVQEVKTGHRITLVAWYNGKTPFK